jgi:hypothetical protein
MLVAFPLPSPSWDIASQVAVFVLYAATLGWALSTLWWGAWSNLCGVLSFLAAFFLLLRSDIVLPVFVVSVFGLWTLVRSRRLARSKNLERRALVLALVPLLSWGALAQSVTPRKVIPKELSGLLLNEFSSCAMIDQIPWRFRPDGRKTRMLISDRLRSNTEVRFSQWQVHQVMDPNGFVSYIFRRPLASGRFESIITKNLIYNRVVDTPRGRRTVEVQELKNLVNRPVLSFFHEDGGSVTYSPSSIGNALLTLQQASTTGRSLPPIFLRGNYCDRPESQEDIDRIRQAEAQQTKEALEKAGGGASPAPAPAK